MRAQYVSSNHLIKVSWFYFDLTNLFSYITFLRKIIIIFQYEQNCINSFSQEDFHQRVVFLFSDSYFVR